MVAVGMRVSPHPPHRSRRAALPQRALASGDDAKASYRIREKLGGHPNFWQHPTFMFSGLFFGGFPCLKMSPRLIVTIIRHLQALCARIAHHPLSKLGARQEARDCPSRGLKPLRCFSGSLTEDGIKPLSLYVCRVEGLLSLHQRPGDDQHLGGDLHQHLGADADLPLAAFQQSVVVGPEVAG